MTTVLRLKGLDEAAEIEDVRRFFQGLNIPKGGVCIVGGKCREAFIAFATEMDAELALCHTGNLLRDSEVNLRISSLAELEHKLKACLEKKNNKRKCHAKKPSKPATSELNCRAKRSKTLKPATSGQASDPVFIPPVPPDVKSNPRMTEEPNGLPSKLETAFLLGIYTVLQGQSIIKEGSPPDFSTLNEDFLQDVSSVSPGKEALPQVVTNASCVPTQKPGYIRMFGLPASTTKEEVEEFFEGLHVEEAMINVKLGARVGCLVKFANELDADNAHLFNHMSLGPSCVEIRTASEKIWTKASENCDSECEEISPNKSGPLRENLDYRHQAKSNYKRRVLQPQLPKKPRSEQKMEYIVKVTNLPKDMTKTQIIELFGCPDIPYKKVILLREKTGARTDIAFLILRNQEDYNYAINLNGCHVQSGAIEVTPATQDLINKTISENYCSGAAMQRNCYVEKEGAAGRIAEKRDCDEKTFLFVRNMPQDVQKRDIKMFFQGYKLKDIHIVLLHNSDGSGTGEAVVQFSSAQQAAEAQELQSQAFGGNKLLMTRISAKLREDIIS